MRTSLLRCAAALALAGWAGTVLAAPAYVQVHNPGSHHVNLYGLQPQGPEYYVGQVAAGTSRDILVQQPEFWVARRQVDNLEYGRGWVGDGRSLVVWTGRFTATFANNSSVEMRIEATDGYGQRSSFYLAPGRTSQVEVTDGTQAYAYRADRNEFLREYVTDAAYGRVDVYCDDCDWGMVSLTNRAPIDVHVSRLEGGRENRSSTIRSDYNQTFEARYGDYFLVRRSDAPNSQPLYEFEFRPGDDGREIMIECPDCSYASGQGGFRRAPPAESAPNVGKTLECVFSFGISC